MCSLYTHDMEVQVNVTRGDGEPIKGSFRGRNWHGYTDGLTTWKSFRIPWNARDNPYYEDKDITFDISKHAKAIGMTGWDWKNKCSRWVAFDFDSIVGHKQGLTNEELQTILGRIRNYKYCTIYASTGGNGYHIYVVCNVQDVSTHTEHAAVARCILARISTEIQYDLEAKVDACGSNIWVWHTRAVPGKSFKLIHEGETLTAELPNWREFLDRVDKHKLLPIKTSDKDLLIASQNSVALDDEHLQLLEWFERDSALHWYDNERQMLVCHTADLLRAHTELKLRGIFNTLAEGKNHGRDQNCFCFPLIAGSWIVRRHTRGCQEHTSWSTDLSGWSSIFYNRLPSLRTASGEVGGIEGEKEYNYKNLNQAIEALVMMGLEVEVPIEYAKRPTIIKQVADKLVVSFKLEDGDDIDGWAKKKTKWERVFFLPISGDDVELPDSLLRHVTALGTDIGWFVQTNHKWVLEGTLNVGAALLASGYKINQVKPVMGSCVIQNWQQVNMPFKPEYPGKRKWNMNAAQFRFNPKQGKHPTWDLILEHCGQSLHPEENEWCYEHGIITGAIYLQLWIACLFQFPDEPLPYLVFYGEQNTGKSIFHESIALLFTGGYIRADHALTNPSGFNGELLNAILCVVEETNLSKRGWANDRIKDWVTGREISIHAKGRTPFNIPNTTHWVQCTNDPSYCPILPGDTRIILAYVDQLQQEIPKTEIIKRCLQESPAFLYTLIERELPDVQGRLRLPVLDTELKNRQQELNKDMVAEFLDTMHMVDGKKELFSSVYESFVKWLDPLEKHEWSKRRFSKGLTTQGVLVGRSGNDGSMYIGNISFIQCEAGTRLKIEKGRLR